MQKHSLIKWFTDTQYDVPELEQHFNMLNGVSSLFLMLFFIPWPFPVQPQRRAIRAFLKFQKAKS